MIEPKVSISISTYNRRNLLPFAVESVIKQTFSDWELIVCDDGSTDGTSEYMSGLTKIDSRIKYIRHENNIGKSNNMRSGFEAARGKYFIKFDDDDILLPNCLENTVTLLDNNSHVDFVGGDTWIIDIKGVRDLEWSEGCSQRRGRKDLKEGIVSNLLEVVFIKQSFYIGATLFRTKVLKEVDYMTRDLQSCEDNDLFVKLALANKTAYYIPIRLMEYRVHSEQKQRKKAIAHLESYIKYLTYYKFIPKHIEEHRNSKLIQAKRQLGLCLLENDNSSRAKQLLLQGCSKSKIELFVAHIVTMIPINFFRKEVISIIRKLKSIREKTLKLL